MLTFDAHTAAFIRRGLSLDARGVDVVVLDLSVFASLQI